MAWSRGESLLAVGTNKGNLLIYDHRSARYYYYNFLTRENPPGAQKLQ